MALVVRDSDTTTTDGTEQTLGVAQTFAGVYVIQIDLSAMQAGDTVVLKAKTKTLKSLGSIFDTKNIIKDILSSPILTKKTSPKIVRK